MSVGTEASKVSDFFLYNRNTNLKLESRNFLETVNAKPF